MTGEAPAAYEEKSVPSSGRGPSISRSPAICQERGLPYSRSSGAAVLPRRDKVVTLLDKIRNNRHGNPLTSLPYWRPIWSATSWPRNRARKLGQETGLWHEALQRNLRSELSCGGKSWDRKQVGECMRRRVSSP